jgi:hypothetical protein
LIKYITEKPPQTAPKAVEMKSIIAKVDILGITTQNIKAGTPDMTIMVRIRYIIALIEVYFHSPTK